LPESKSLYARLGGYDAVAAVSENLVGRLMADERLGRFWAHRGEDGLKRELQLLVNFLCNVTGGPMVYTGRDMKISHKGMGIDHQLCRKHEGRRCRRLACNGSFFQANGKGSGRSGT
jgi:truncated hemoglobin YjbI